MKNNPQNIIDPLDRLGVNPELGRRVDKKLIL
jgi:hypothetical protein